MYNIFIKNEFLITYLELIRLAKDRQLDSDMIYENHHIIPKSIGGNNESTNLVLLSPKEHLLAHELLVKITEGEHKRKMIYAHWMMATVKNEHQSRITLTSDEISSIKKTKKEIGKSKETCEKIGKSRKNKKAVFNSELSIVKYIDLDDLPHYSSQGYILGGRPKSDKCKKKISETNLKLGIVPKTIGWNKGLTKENSKSLKKLSEKLQGRPAWNKGNRDSGFGKNNPMSNPESIKRMLETRKKNKLKNDNK